MYSTMGSMGSLMTWAAVTTISLDMYHAVPQPLVLQILKTAGVGGSDGPDALNDAEHDVAETSKNMMIDILAIKPPLWLQ